MTHTKGAPWRLTAAPAPKRHPRLGNAKVREVYNEAHLAWRAGALTDFYFGERGPGDPTVVWRIDGTEYAQDARDKVHAHIQRLTREAGIADISFGEQWCGYQAVNVTYSNGRRLTERFDGCHVVIEGAA